MIITLIGYRGCGKSTVGPLLAAERGWTCVDSDSVVESEAGCSIRDLFANEGEAGFRARETAALRRILQGDHLVVSAGGGAILASENRSLLRAAGPVVWLRADVATLASRIGGDSTTAGRRPSLTGRPVAEEIADVLALRNPVYQQTADVIIDTDLLTPEEIVRAIESQLAHRQNEGIIA